MLISPKLPLSFGASVFGMNLLTFGPSWNLHKEMTYICQLSSIHYSDQKLTRCLVFVSTIIIATSLILAFSSFVRSLLAFIFGVAWMWFVTTTGIYDLWYLLKQDSGSLTRKQTEITRKWKEESRKKYLQRQRDKLKKHEKKNLEKEKKNLEKENKKNLGLDQSPETVV